MKRWSRFVLTYEGALVIAIGAILTSSVYAIYHAKSLKSSKEPESALATAIAPVEELEVELINVLPNGFEPVEIVRPAGRFVLLFDNQSRIQPLEFRLERTGMPVVAAVDARSKTDSKVLNLPAGEYHVTEASHPNWNLKLTLTKR